MIISLQIGVVIVFLMILTNVRHRHYCLQNFRHYFSMRKKNFPMSRIRRLKIEMRKNLNYS